MFFGLGRTRKEQKTTNSIAKKNHHWCYFGDFRVKSRSFLFVFSDDRVRHIWRIDWMTVNWLQKNMFSKKMADLAMKHNLVPPEQCTAPGKDGNEGNLLKQFHTDHFRTMHISHATISADLENCYD